MDIDRDTLPLRPLHEGDLERLVALMDRCLSHDGGLNSASHPTFIARHYLQNEGRCIESINGAIIGAVALAPGSDGHRPVMVMVDPMVRGDGPETALMAWAREVSYDTPLMARCESLSDSVRALLVRSGLRQVFGEFIMCRDLSRPVDVPLWNDFVIHSWNRSTSSLFYRAYQESFQERPGFPDWSFDEWTEAMIDDDFLPGESVVAMSGDAPVGFLLLAGSSLEQIGVVPTYRRMGLGSLLLAEGLIALQRRGVSTAWLNVGTNNPEAMALYTKHGFVTYGERGRFA